MPDPVPPHLRNALIDAMGGWGPFTVREIQTIFEDHGFLHTEEVAPEQGVRRTAAAEYVAAINWSDTDQRQRLLQLIDEVLEFYPETDGETPRSPGRRLRRAVTRVQTLDDRPVLGEDGVARTPDEADPFDVWPPERIRLFFSHTSEHRALVSEVASVLERWPFACFVAHQEIEPSLQWQEVIESGLSTCDALVAFLTEDFRSSAWCDQEVGWALGRGLIVIPVHLSAQPHGFAGAIQAVPAALTDPPAVIGERIATALMTAVFRQTRPGAVLLVEPLADAITSQFCQSRSQDLARRRFDFLRRLPRPLWTPARRLQVDAACDENRAIREARLVSGQSVPDAVRGLWA